ncbi:helix-turn-helix domain-containing protein [Streptomyces sp. NPDC044984]|uniref:helix-turn-helix domain-containing protein n=1 Tax=Streptomyces sp. NPDC044984 TaxID=3154335 RepID=UPI0034071C2A
MNTSTAERGLSGIGVLDKASLLLDAVGAGPASLAEPVASTGLERPAVHRLTRALERPRLLDRDTHGRCVLGSRLGDPDVTTWQGRLNARAASVLVRTRDPAGGSGRCAVPGPVPPYWQLCGGGAGRRTSTRRARERSRCRPRR